MRDDVVGQLTTNCIDMSHVSLHVSCQTRLPSNGGRPTAEAELRRNHHERLSDCRSSHHIACLSVNIRRCVYRHILGIPCYNLRTISRRHTACIMWRRRKAHASVLCPVIVNNGRPIGQVIIFCSCGFYLLSFFLPSFSPILSGRRFDVYDTSMHDVVLVRI